MILCSDNTFYTGVTNDVKLRFHQHCAGINKKAYTHSRRPLTLVYSQGFIQIAQAIDFEKRLKKLSRAKKEALINGKYNELPKLAKKEFKEGE
jgi:putative endonuclease